MTHVTPELPELTLEMAQAVLAAQPFSVLVGARVTRFGNGEATLEIDARPDLEQQNGHLHGGLVAYAADNAITFAAGTALGPAVLTGGVSVEYLRPARGTTLRANARVEHSGKRRALCRCELVMVDTNPDGTEKTELCAVAQGTVFPA